MDYNNSRRQVLIAMLLLFLVIVIGVIGYTQIDNFGFIDSVYMTIITISTVGYGEVKLVHSQLSFFIQLKARKGDQEKWRIMLSL